MVELSVEEANASYGAIELEAYFRHRNAFSVMSSSDHPLRIMVVISHRSISPIVYKRVSLKFLISPLLSSSYVISVLDHSIVATDFPIAIQQLLALSQCMHIF